MRLCSWNVNGLRALSAKPTFWPWFHSCRADVICFQETKARPEQLSEELLSPSGFEGFFSSPIVKKGYSGVAVYTSAPPLAVKSELPNELYAAEGRTLHLEFPDFHLLNIYFPNGQSGNERLSYKMRFLKVFLEHAEWLRKTKPVVVCGDFNIAHKTIDLAFPAMYQYISGFLQIERDFISRMVELGYIDTFRHVNGDVKDNYTWWSYRYGERERNEGWRIDYFFVTKELEKSIARAWIEPHIAGSDHCPIGIDLIL